MGNAAKVQTALKLSEEDQQTIVALKKEIEKAWKMVDSSHEKVRKYSCASGQDAASGGQASLRKQTLGSSCCVAASAGCWNKKYVICIFALCADAGSPSQGYHHAAEGRDCKSHTLGRGRLRTQQWGGGCSERAHETEGGADQGEGRTGVCAAHVLQHSVIQHAAGQLSTAQHSLTEGRAGQPSAAQAAVYSRASI